MRKCNVRDLTLAAMVAALYDGKALSGDQLDELRDWLETR